MNPDLRDIIFLDIETVRVEDKHDTLNERLKSQWARKAGFFKRLEGQTDADLFEERAGIYAEFGKVIVIACGRYFDTETGELGLKTRYYASENEQEILINFKQMLDKQDPLTTRLCAHNGREFDYPYLCRRMLINGIAPPPLLNQTNRKPWENTLLDTMDMWKFGDFKHYTSLELLATLFNVPTSKGGMDGGMVNEVFYVQKDLTRIAEYCVADVVAIAQVYLRLKGLEVMRLSNIVAG
jgi:DNA polymerase elongation subunit (family B)